MQYCVPKFTYGKTKESHYKFLIKYMPQKTKDTVIDKPKLFGNINIEEYKKKMSENYYKWIISPESILSDEEFKLLAEKVVLAIEYELGKRLDWQSVIHRDTAHPHMHMLFNGIDQNGKCYSFPRRMIKGGRMREICQEILTEIKGERTKEQIQAARDARPLADRLTEFDDVIEKMTVRELYEKQDVFRVPVDHESITPEIRKRLDHLKDLGLCIANNSSYILEKNWKQDITMMGRYNTYLDAKKYIDKGKEFNIYKPEKQHRVSGKILKFYKMNDENIWSNAIVLEEKSGNGIFVPVWNAEAFEKFNIGDEVDIVSTEGREGKTNVKIYPARTAEELKKIIEKIKKNNTKKNNDNSKIREENNNNQDEERNDSLER